MSTNHGANLYSLSSKYGFSKEEFMDFSSNINPFGTSSLAKQYIVNNIDMVSMYPDPDYIDLKTSISNYCKCSIDNIVLGSGATELISSFIHTINPKQALLLSPAYSEYEKELSKINCSIEKYFAKEEDNFHINLENLIKTIMANFILEGIYFYSGFMFFYNLERNGKMPGSAQEIRYINRDENTHLWLFRSLIRELQKEEIEIFNKEFIEELRLMMKTGVEHEINWGNYVIGENIQGINKNLIDSYIKYLGNKRLKEIGLEPLFDGYDKNPAPWVDSLSNANSVKTDFFEAKSTAYAKASVLIDDL